MTELSRSLLLTALRRADKIAGPAGESALDVVIREANGDVDLRARLLTVVNEIVDELSSPEEWHALQGLIGQTQLRHSKLGERLASRIETGAVRDEAALWAAFAAVFLGATLKSPVLQALEAAKLINPGQWFALMRDTQAVRSVENGLLSLAKLPSLRSQDALDLLRSYKRWAIASGVPWNVTSWNFLQALPDEIESEVTAKIAKSLGPSFAIEAPVALVEADTAEVVHVTESLYALPDILGAMERVVANLEMSRTRALEAA